ncbi:restriction endonuclease [Catenulispora sp. NL8]|uniref:Restriction endonuclease n=1 Tax=Catenulispora pinistramenti TaxID=2705254 RepID=A0ABS5KHP7_9ACTN|nr:restriction endonuclease [Catenulispora pinistramenti]MBS2545505.1 restriction endonuclease [Catenulispora pinistramenti]
MRKSVEFEQLLAKIVKELEPEAVVTWDDHITGRLSGRKRQIDVSISREEPAFLGIIDAKDYKRPASIERIDALTGVMRDVGANYGALACSGGFAESIHTYARNCGISLFNVHDAESVNWSLELKIPILWYELMPVVGIGGKPYLEAGDSIVTGDPRGIQVTADGGKTLIDPMSTFERYWNGPTANRAPGMRHHLTSDRPVEAVVTDAAGNRQLRDLMDYAIVYTVQPTAWLGKFQPAECRGLVDVLDEQAFNVSHLPDAAIPMQRDDSWEILEEPDKFAVTARGTAVVCTAPVLISDPKITSLRMTHLESGMTEWFSQS